MSDEMEHTESGQPILRHTPRETAWEPAMGGDAESLQAIDRHITRYVGPVATVFHEIVSDLVHIDVHIVEPTPERNFYTLVTSGMSDRPMTTPAGAEEWCHAEVMLCLPPDWTLPKAFKTAADLPEEAYWPIRWLKTLARLPHEYQTWLGWGHTVPNGDPPQPFAPNTQLCGVVLLPPLRFGDAFRTLRVSEEKTIHFWATVPLYASEMSLKLRGGVDALYPGFKRGGVDELLKIDRPSTAMDEPPMRKKLFGLF